MKNNHSLFKLFLQSFNFIYFFFQFLINQLLDKIGLDHDLLWELGKIVIEAREEQYKEPTNHPHCVNAGYEHVPFGIVRIFYQRVALRGCGVDLVV